MNHSNRYIQQTKLPEIGEDGQEKLRNARVLIVGIGGLGCPAAQYLVASGVGRIGLLDHDTVDFSNLHRQILFSEKHVGSAKVEVAKEVLSQLNSEVSFRCYNLRLDENNALGIFKDYDVILDGTDNFPTKYLINDACVLLEKPFVGASIYKYQGQLSVFNYENGPTYRCLYPNHLYGDTDNCENTGVLGILPGLVGVAQATETIKMIVKIGKVLSGKMKLLDVFNMTEQHIRFKRNEKHVMLAKKRPLQLEQLTCKVLDTEKTYLDVRERYEEPRLVHSSLISIPLNQLEDRYPEIPRDKKIYVFCQSGIRSEKAIALLRKAFDFNNLINVAGGVEHIIQG
ncbi:MAG: HesA/MoeB/ThiF family protein [Bacteroidota bacterium]